MPLDKQMLETMPVGTIFAEGTGEIPELAGQMSIRWVAVRGGGVPDWAFYYGPAEWSAVKIRSQGSKAHFEKIIRKLVPCDDEAWSHYRM